MKTIVLGDIHGRNVWKDIVFQEEADRVIFIGDYFDSFDIGPADQMFNFKEIIEFKEKNECEVIMLIGNHDFHYYPGGETYSGYQYGAAPAIRQLLKENEQLKFEIQKLDEKVNSILFFSENFNKYASYPPELITTISPFFLCSLNLSKTVIFNWFSITSSTYCSP